MRGALVLLLALMLVGCAEKKEVPSNPLDSATAPAETERPGNETGGVTQPSDSK